MTLFSNATVEIKGKNVLFLIALRAKKELHSIECAMNHRTFSPMMKFHSVPQMMADHLLDLHASDEGYHTLLGNKIVTGNKQLNAEF